MKSELTKYRIWGWLWIFIAFSAPFIIINSTTNDLLEGASVLFHWFDLYMAFKNFKVVKELKKPIKEEQRRKDEEERVKQEKLRKEKERERENEEEISSLKRLSKSLYIDKEEDGYNITYFLCGPFDFMMHLCDFEYEIVDKHNINIIVKCDHNALHTDEKNAFVANTINLDIPNSEYFKENWMTYVWLRNEVISTNGRIKIGAFNGEQLLVDEIEQGRKEKAKRDREIRVKNFKIKYGNMSQEEREERLSNWRRELKEKKEKEERELQERLEEMERAKKEEEERQREKTYVYLMCNKQNNFHKIGISKNLEHRERTLQSAEPLIECLGARLYETRRDAYNAEQELHNMFRHKNIRGEWFNLTEDDIELVCNYLNVS